MVLVVTVQATSSDAGPIVPVFDTFGSLPTATFGDSGIPTHAVAITTIVDGDATITLGLTAHGRLGQPTVSNDGAGTFYALPGGFPGEPHLARWNFAFYIDVEEGALSDYVFQLLFDFDPGRGTLAEEHGVMHFTGASGTRSEGSENLGSPPLAIPPVPDFPAFITPPSHPGFDPSVFGEYTFSLRAFALDTGDLLGESAIRVNVVPEPSMLAIFTIGAFGAAGVARRRVRTVELDNERQRRSPDKATQRRPPVAEGGG